MRKLEYLFIAIVMSINCSCGNSGKPQVDERAIKDSIEKAIKDSIRNAEAEKARKDSIEKINELHSKKVVEQELKAFLSEYVNTRNDNIEQFLSSDYNTTIKNPYAGEWNLFGLNSAADVQRYSIINIGSIDETRTSARVKLYIDNEGDYYEKNFTIQMLLEKGKWCVDEINTVKKDLKSLIKDVERGDI